MKTTFKMKTKSLGKSALAGFASAAALTACTVGPDYKPPVTHAPDSYLAPGDSALPDDQSLVTEATARSRWWQAFRAPAVNDLVERALANNYDVAAAKARVAQVQEQVAAAEGALMPQVSFGANVGRQKYGVTMFGPLNISVPAYTYYSAGPSVSLPLDLFGGGRRAVEENEARAAYQVYELDAARLSLVANVVTEAVALASARAEAGAMQDMVDDDRRMVELLGLAVDGGTAPRTQLLEAEGQLAMDEGALPELRKQEATARHALSVLVGKTPQEWVPPAFKLEDFVLPGDIPARLPSELVHDRPDIRAAEAQLHAASAAIGVATADLYPKIDLMGAYAMQALTPGNLLNSSGAAWSFAASVTQPLFAGGRLSAERRAAVAGYQAALADYRQVVVASFGDVADCLQALSDDAERFRAASDSALAAQSALELGRKSYAEGYANVLELLAVERRASEAQIGLAQARARRLVDTAALFMSLGGAPLISEQAGQQAQADAVSDEKARK